MTFTGDGRAHLSEEESDITRIRYVYAQPFSKKYLMEEDVVAKLADGTTYNYRENAIRSEDSQSLFRITIEELEGPITPPSAEYLQALRDAVRVMERLGNGAAATAIRDMARRRNVVM